jgi:multiple sugar transport system substrate-binding protein
MAREWLRRLAWSAACDEVRGRVAMKVSPRRWVARLALVGAVLALACGGCGRNPARGRVPIRFSVWGTGQDFKHWGGTVRQFNESQRRVWVELELVQGAGYSNKMLSMLVGHCAPDVMAFLDKPFFQFAQYGVFEDLGPYLEKDQEIRKSDFFPQFLKAFSYHGRQLGLPWDGHTVLVYYNKDLFAREGLPEPKADWRWDDFVRVTKALTKDTDGDGRVDQFGFIAPMWLNELVWVWGAGGRDLNPEMTRCVTDSPGTIRGLRFQRDLVFKYHVCPQAREMAGMNQDSLFNAGRLAMALGGAYWMAFCRELTGVNWDVVMPPRGPAGQWSRMTTDGITMWRESPHKPEAWAFIRYLLSDRGQARIASLGRGIPARRKMAYSPAFLRPDLPQHTIRFLEALPRARPQSINDKTDEMNTVYDREWDRMLLGEDPAATGKAMARQINVILSGRGAL